MYFCQQNTYTIIISTFGALDIQQAQYTFCDILVVFFVKQPKCFKN